MKLILENKYTRITFMMLCIFILIQVIIVANCIVSLYSVKSEIDTRISLDDKGTIMYRSIEDIQNIFVYADDKSVIEDEIPSTIFEHVRYGAILDKPKNIYDITQKSNLTVDELDLVIKTTLDKVGHSNSLLGLTGQALYDMEQKYDVNALFALGVASLESGWGSSYAATHKNNLFGMYCGTSTASRFDSVTSNIDAFGNLIRNNYIDKGLTNVSAIGKKYCTTPTWHSHVNIIMGKYQSTAKDLFDIN